MTKKSKLWRNREEIKDRDAVKSCENTFECEEVRDHREKKNYNAIKAV